MRHRYFDGENVILEKTSTYVCLSCGYVETIHHKHIMSKPLPAIDNPLITCPNCNDSDKDIYDQNFMIEIDVEMVPLILSMNSVGIKTIMCCQGHLDEYYKYHDNNGDHTGIGPWVDIEKSEDGLKFLSTLSTYRSYYEHKLNRLRFYINIDQSYEDKIRIGCYKEYNKDDTEYDLISARILFLTFMHNSCSLYHNKYGNDWMTKEIEQ